MDILATLRDAKAAGLSISVNNSLVNITGAKTPEALMLVQQLALLSPIQ